MASFDIFDVSVNLSALHILMGSSKAFKPCFDVSTLQTLVIAAHALISFLSVRFVMNTCHVPYRLGVYICVSIALGTCVSEWIFFLCVCDLVVRAFQILFF